MDFRIACGETKLKIVISGVQGYLGSNLFEYFSSNFDNEVYGYDLISGFLTGERIGFYTINNLVSILKERPDVLIHAGAQTDVTSSLLDPIDSINKNITNTTELILKILELTPSTHLIYINTGGALYAKTNTYPTLESEIADPSSVYGLTKLTSEKLLKLYGELSGLKWSSLALSNLYGPKNKKGIFWNLAKSVLNDEIFNIYGANSKRDYIYITDVIDAIEKQMISPSFGRIHVSSGISTSNMEVIQITSNIIKKPIKYDTHEPRMGEIIDSCLSNDLAGFVLKWKPQYSIIEGLEKTMRSYGL